LKKAVAPKSPTSCKKQGEGPLSIVEPPFRPAQPLQLRRDIALRCPWVNGAPTPAPSDANQRRQPNPKIAGDLALYRRHDGDDGQVDLVESPEPEGSNASRVAGQIENASPS